MIKTLEIPNRKSMINPLLNKYDVQKMELIETLYWQRLYERRGAHQHGKIDNVYFIHLEGTGMFLMPDADILAFNRVIGLGLFRKTDNDFIEKITDIYKIAGIKRFFVQLNPMAHHKTEDLLVSKGFEYYNDWVKLFRHLDAPIPPAESDFKIVNVGKENRKAFADIITRSFDFPAIVGQRFAKSLGSANHSHFLALHGKKPIAAASMYIHGKIASMAGAGTIPEYRNCGAQSALLARRLQLAKDSGCEYAIVETAKDSDERKVSSFRNMIRAGFDIAYVRPNFIKYL